jgi:hypothetical protein
MQRANPSDHANRGQIFYPISEFTAAPTVQMSEAYGFAGAGPRVRVSGNIARVNDINELERWGVLDRVKVILVQGKDPDDPKEGDNSRSVWVFDALCHLVRAGVPDDVIFSIFTDPEFGISESILEKGNNAERYAIRQIERAKEEVIDPWLRKLNEQYAVIANLGGKCRIIQEIMDHTLRRNRLTRMSFEDFRNAWMNQQVSVGSDAKGNMKTMEAGKWWLNHPMRRQYKTIVFAPGEETTDAYNLWQGFGFTAMPGMGHESFLQHVRDNVCEGNEDYYRYLLGWMARVVQRPSEPGEVAIVLRGAQSGANSQITSDQ